MLLYNLFFTSTPVVALGIFERNISREFTHLVPALYLFGVRNMAFKRFRFWTFMLEGFYQSLACFYVTIAVFNEVAIDFTGHTPTDVELGSVMAVLSIFNANLFVFLRLHSKTLISTLAILLPNVFLLLWTATYGFFPNSDLKDIGHLIFINPNFYLTMLIGTIICHFPRLFVLFAQQLFWPTDIQLIQELESLGSVIKVEEENAEELKYPNAQTSSGSLPKPDNILSLQDQGSPLQVEADEKRATGQSSSIVSPTIDAEGPKVHFNAPALALTDSSPRKRLSFIEDQRSQLSVSESLAERRSIHLQVMTRGVDQDQHGFSFSESPGVRDLILGRRDVRMSPAHNYTIPISPDARTSVLSTQSMPGASRIRPRANTFTYGKRKRRFSLGQKNFSQRELGSTESQFLGERDDEDEEFAPYSAYI